MGKMDTLTLARDPMDTPCDVFFNLVNLVCINCANQIDGKIIEFSQHCGPALAFFGTGNV